MTAQPLKRAGTSSRRYPVAHDVVKIVLLALVFVALGWLFNSDFVARHFDIQAWREVMQQADFLGGPVAGAVAFVAAGGAVIALGMPRIWIAALGGAVYGAVTGSVLAIVAALIGASILYYVGRRFLRDVVRRRVGGRLEVWRARFRANGFWWVLYGRLFPLSNSTAVSVLCGSCEVPYAKYAAASFIGFIPFTVTFAMFGSGGAKANAWQIALGLGLMLLVFLSRNLLRAVFPVRRDEGEGAA
jgi:uncharacterized membrane protein YdjX (TVP38/TMEM64 family)